MQSAAFGFVFSSRQTDTLNKVNAVLFNPSAYGWKRQRCRGLILMPNYPYCTSYYFTLLTVRFIVQRVNFCFCDVLWCYGCKQHDLILPAAMLVWFSFSTWCLDVTTVYMNVFCSVQPSAVPPPHTAQGPFNASLLILLCFLSDCQICDPTSSKLINALSLTSVNHLQKCCESVELTVGEWGNIRE